MFVQLSRGFVFVFLSVAAQPLIAQQPPPADFVLQGGQVHTLDANDTLAEAVAIREGKIVFVGSDARGKEAHRAENGGLSGRRTDGDSRPERDARPPDRRGPGRSSAAVHATPFDRRNPGLGSQASGGNAERNGFACRASM